MAEKQTALVKKQSVVSDLTMTPQKFIEAAIASKLFRDTADAAQAYVKITLGASLNLDPVTSMASIYIVQGKPSLSTNLMAARLNQCGYGRYEILEKTPEKCRIQFYRLVEDWTPDGKAIKKWVKPGPPEEYNLQLAQKAGLTKNPVWQGHGMNMNFNRAMSNGIKTYFPEILNGVPLYAPEELDPDMKLTVTADGDVVPDAEYTQAPAPKKPVPVQVKDAGNWSDSVSDIRNLEISQLMAATGTDEASFLTTLLQKDAIEKLTGPEKDKVVSILKQKQKAQPEKVKEPF